MLRLSMFSESIYELHNNNNMKCIYLVESGKSVVKGVQRCC